MCMCGMLLPEDTAADIGDIGTEARTKESKQGDINSEGPSVALVMPGGAG